MVLFKRIFFGCQGHGMFSGMDMPRPRKTPVGFYETAEKERGDKSLQTVSGGRNSG